jgi:hypothetical protein
VLVGRFWFCFTFLSLYGKLCHTQSLLLIIKIDENCLIFMIFVKIDPV